MQRICFILIAIIITSSTTRAQNPKVTEKFDQLFIGENFDSSNSYWSTLSNTDNLLIVQEGEYIMHRKATFSPYAVMANFSFDFSAYRLTTSLKLDKASAADGSIGLIFMAQPDGKGGFIFEINKDQKYRLRQITGNSYRYLTGLPKELGWVKSELIKGLNLPNLVEIRTAEKKYDLFVNNKIILSFDALEYKTGNIGFIIGPASKGKADFLYLFTNANAKAPVDSSTLEVTKSAAPETDVIALVESIITLKTQLNKLQEENEMLKGTVAAMKMGEKEQESGKNAAAKQIKILESQLKKSTATFDSLLKVNNDLLKYKEMVKGNNNGDLVINLSKNLKNEKLVNEELKKTNKLLNDSIAGLKNQLKESKSKTATQNSSQSKNKEATVSSNDTIAKPKEEFILPKEN